MRNIQRPDCLFLLLERKKSNKYAWTLLWVWCSKNFDLVDWKVLRTLSALGEIFVGSCEQLAIVETPKKGFELFLFQSFVGDNVDKDEDNEFLPTSTGRPCIESHLRLTRLKSSSRLQCFSLSWRHFRWE